MTYTIAIAREKGFTAYLGEGKNCWPAAHVNLLQLMGHAERDQFDTEHPNPRIGSELAGAAARWTPTGPGLIADLEAMKY